MHQAPRTDVLDVVVGLLLLARRLLPPLVRGALAGAVVGEDRVEAALELGHGDDLLLELGAVKLEHGVLGLALKRGRDALGARSRRRRRCVGVGVSVVAPPLAARRRGRRCRSVRALAVARLGAAAAAEHARREHGKARRDRRGGRAHEVERVQARQREPRLRVRLHPRRREPAVEVGRRAAAGGLAERRQHRLGDPAVGERVGAGHEVGRVGGVLLKGEEGGGRR